MNGAPIQLPLHDDDTTHVKLKDSSTSAVTECSYGLCVPSDEVVYQLEWLSFFNDDYGSIGEDTKLISLALSSPHGSSSATQCRIKEAPSFKPRESFNNQNSISVFESGIHSACKSHRVRKARSGGRVWSLDILKPISVNNRIDESSGLLHVASRSSASSEPLSIWLRQDALKQSSKKMKQDADPVLARRCSHCLVQKTPQWRRGPKGPKTLCNACGVRYKSGRLVPEYRPVASPSYVNEVHSNSHRRILEMRRSKEGEMCVEIHGSKVERREETTGKGDGRRVFCVGAGKL
ncbi:hypothetical protein L7F22_028064 [Adiantum nelumboides]|nr:hypothetical protein [Adiantum nelumboides]